MKVSHAAVGTFNELALFENEHPGPILFGCGRSDSPRRLCHREQQTLEARGETRPYFRICAEDHVSRPVLLVFPFDDKLFQNFLGEFAAADISILEPETVGSGDVSDIDDLPRFYLLDLIGDVNYRIGKSDPEKAKRGKS